MNEAGFKAWMEANDYAPAAISTKLSEARSLFRAYGDLDKLYDDDGLAGVAQELAYSAADRDVGKPNPSRLTNLSDINRDLGNYRTTLKLYRDFRAGATRGEKQSRLNRAAVLKAMADCNALEMETFLSRYGFGARINYWIDYEGRRYPAKAIYGVAHRHMPGGQIVRHNSAVARAQLKALGFTILSDRDGEEDDDFMRAASVNMILYGPPGTGKTHSSVAHAVRLCDGLDPLDTLLHDRNRRTELKARYDALVEARRIDFVTFHQSYSYEEFVEGLRPVQGGSDSEDVDSGSAGFSLVPEDGIFRRIAHRAATSKGGGGVFSIGDRRIFKMSLGRFSNPEDAFLFDEAIAQEYVAIGFDDIDWTDSRFSQRDAIIAACKKLDVEYPDDNRKAPTPQTGRVQCPMIFRNVIRRGDLIVVSRRNSHFRAIGEVTGDYEYVQRDSRLYLHRRKVKWLWIDRGGAPADEIYGKGFVQGTVYELEPEEVKIPALEGYINGQLSGAAGAGPEPYVLIIDEINRGNISKIFGELITLIEPDKRAGETNALKVQLPYSKKPFSVPSNLHIIGTMNTADRSIARLDTALRRRFVFHEVAPDASVLPQMVDGVALRQVLEVINDRIEYLIDREHRIGHAYFMACHDRSAIDAAMRDKVIPLLQEYFFDDWGKVAAVLGEDHGGAFLECRKLRDPTGENEDRKSWRVRDDFSVEAYAQLTAKAVDGGRS